MKTGMVVLNYNDYETTANYLNLVSSFSCLDKIVVVDNCSPENDFEKLKSFSSNKVTVIRTDANKGYAAGNNVGVLKLIEDNNVDYIVISNPDIVLEERDLKKLLEDFTNPEIAVVAPIVKQGEELLRGWKLPSFSDDLISNFNNQKGKARLLIDANNKYVEAVSGCFFVIRKKVFLDINMFDENTFLYYEENILGKKLKDKGYKTFFDKDVTITHDLSVSVDRSFGSLKKYKILKQSQRYYEKRYNKTNVFGIFLLYITYLMAYLITAIRLLMFKRRK